MGKLNPAKFASLDEFLDDLFTVFGFGFKRGYGVAFDKLLFLLFLQLWRNRVRTLIRQSVIVAHYARRPTARQFPAANSRSELFAFREAVEELPELKRLLISIAGNMVEKVNQFLDHVHLLSRDRKSPWSIKLEETDEIRLLGGDSHDGGAFILSIKMGPIQLVYKPRELLAEAYFYNLVRSVKPPLKNWSLPRVYSGDGHSWMDEVRGNPASTEKEVKDAFWNFGFVQGIAISIGISDLHASNIIVNCDNPILVDCEVCLQPKLVRDKANGRRLPSHAVWNGLCTGILPNIAWKFDGNRGVDLSGLGGIFSQSQKSPVSQFCEGPMEVGRYENRVYLGNELKFPWDYEREISDGLEYALERAAVHKREDFEACIENLIECQKRVLLRPTEHYRQAIEGSLHPEYLVKTEIRRRFLLDCFDGEKDLPRKIHFEEARACLELDIPKFVTDGRGLKFREIGNTETYSFDPSLYETGNMFALKEFNRQLPSKRFHFERRLLKGSLDACRQFHGVASPSARSDISSLSCRTEREVVSLLRSSFSENLRNGFLGGVWYGFNVYPTGEVEYMALGGDLYSGLGGILHAQQLGVELEVTSIEASELFDSAVAAFLSSIKGGTKFGGALIGPLSGLQAILQCSKIQGRNGIAKGLLRQLLASLEMHSRKNTLTHLFYGYDLAGGVAGAILVCARCFRYTKEERWLDILEQLIRILKQSALVAKGGLFWSAPESAGGLCGVAHGNAGIALACVESFFLCDSRFEELLSIADRAVKWELAYFNQKLVNWPDLRRNDSVSYAWAWCHGAPGILTAYRRMAILLGDKFRGRRILSDLVRFVLSRDVRKRFRVDDLSVCHGALGLIACLSYGADVSAIEVLSYLYPDSRVSNIPDQLVEMDYFQTKSSYGFENPSFFVGSAGRLAVWTWMIENGGKCELSPLSPSLLFPPF